MNDLTEEERLYAIDSFEEITKEVEAFGSQIPCINKITTYNDDKITIRYYDKFFVIYEIIDYTVDGEERSDLAAVALGKHKGDGNVTIIDFRYLGKDKINLFKKGIDAFLTLINNYSIEELPPTEERQANTLSYDEIIQKIATEYLLTKPVIIH